MIIRALDRRHDRVQSTFGTCRWARNSVYATRMRTEPQFGVVRDVITNEELRVPRSVFKRRNLTKERVIDLNVTIIVHALNTAFAFSTNLGVNIGLPT